MTTAANSEEIEFVKMTGAGNDFVLIDNRSGKYTMDWKTAARQLCRRRYGIGADGLLVIEPSQRADFLMRYYNADGSDGGMCGNGGRCAASYVMQQTGTSQINFEALDYVYTGSKENGQRIRLSMKDPVDLQTNIRLQIRDAAVLLHYVDTGAPHAVLFMDELSPAIHDEIGDHGIVALGSAIRNHAEFSPLGTNANFVEVTAKDVISIRTYERGVENETLACGTGSIASAIMAAHLRSMRSPVTVKTLSGETLAVCFDKEQGKFRHVVLEGSARNVFTGNIDLRSLKATVPGLTT